MNVGKLSQVNFAGAMLINGTPEETSQIANAILAESKKGQTYEENFAFESIRQDKLSDTNVTDLFTTEGEALELRRYYQHPFTTASQNESEPDYKEFDRRRTMRPIINENPTYLPTEKDLSLLLRDEQRYSMPNLAPKRAIPKFDLKEGIPDFDSKRFSEIIAKLNLGKSWRPIKNMPTRTHSAREVLEAIKAGLFDFAKLVIRTTA